MKTAAIIGGGVIGGGWVARFLLNGWNVNVFDPDAEAERKIAAVLTNARHALPMLYDRALPAEGTLRFVSSLADAVKDADWVQESVPERIDIKHKVLGEITDNAPAGAVIASSTSGFKPSELTEKGARTVVAHPFNPVYLLPLVELVGAPDLRANAASIFTSVGMYPLEVKAEIDAHIADRLLEAVWREGLWLVKDGIATTEEIDDAIRFGFGLRWAQMGLFETYRIAGGEDGMAHFIAQFGPCLEWPWTKLMDVPELTDDLIKTIADQSDAQSGHLSIRQLERLRDDNLVSMLRALKARDHAAGAVLNTHESALPHPTGGTALRTVDRIVPIDWTDYNGHMNESRYGQIVSDANDGVMAAIGADAAYVKTGFSYFTVDTRIRYLAESKAGDRIVVDSQLLEAKGKKIRIFHRMLDQTGAEIATGEAVMLHVSLETRRTCPPSDQIMAKQEALVKAHASLPQPGPAERL